MMTFHYELILCTNWGYHMCMGTKLAKTKGNNLWAANIYLLIKRRIKDNDLYFLLL